MLETEKANLELHVELDAMRDIEIRKDITNIEEKLADIEEKLEKLATLLNDMEKQRNNQLIKWGTTIIGALISAISMLILKVLLPLIINHKV